MPVLWTEDLATGIERIDEAHRELFARVSGLHDAMRAGRLAEIPLLVAYLQRYALEHFAAEEREMVATGYPAIAQHRRHHQQFVEEFVRHKALLEAEVTASAVVALSRWITEWLNDHVRKVDGDMGRWLRQPRR